MSTQHQLIIHRSSLLLKGIGVATFGLVAFCYPGQAIGALMFPFGVLVLLNGLAVVVRNRRHVTNLYHWGHTLFKKGILESLIGLTALASVAASASPFWELIAVWTILTGSIHMIEFAQLRDTLSRWRVFMMAGLSSLLFGMLVAINLIVEVISPTYEVAIFGLLFGSSMIYSYPQLGELRQYLGHHPKRVYSSKTASA